MEALYGLAMVAAVVTWVAVASDNRRLERIAKPLTIVLLMVAVVVNWEGPYEFRFVATLVALALSLAGDVFLMQERDLFLPGLVAFLLAHIAYVVAFRGPVLSPFSVFMIVTLILVSGPLFLWVRQGLQRKGQQKLIPAVLAYVVVISLMVVTAFTAPGSNGWTTATVLTSALGASLFYASDALIGLHRFVKEMPRAPVAIMVTYHLAQLLLVVSLNQPAGSVS